MDVSAKRMYPELWPCRNKSAIFLQFSGQFKHIIVWRCGQMNGSVSILWLCQWMIGRWWYCGPCLYNIYIYIHTHTCLRQSPKCKHIVQCRHLFVCSLCFLKVSSFVSFGGNFLPCFRLFPFGLPRVPRCDCMFHGRITPISSISSSTYPQYTSISSIYYSTQCAIWCSLRSSLINTWIQQ